MSGSESPSAMTVRRFGEYPREVSYMFSQLLSLPWVSTVECHLGTLLEGLLAWSCAVTGFLCTMG